MLEILLKEKGFSIVGLDSYSLTQDLKNSEVRETVAPNIKEPIKREFDYLDTASNK